MVVDFSKVLGMLYWPCAPVIVLPTDNYWQHFRKVILVWPDEDFVQLTMTSFAMGLCALIREAGGQHHTVTTSVFGEDGCSTSKPQYCYRHDNLLNTKSYLCCNDDSVIQDRAWRCALACLCLRYGLMACEDFRSGPGSGSDEWLEALAGLVRSVEWQM